MNNNQDKQSLEQKYPGLFGSNTSYGTSGLNQAGTSDVSGELTDNMGTKSIDNKGSNLGVVIGASERETSTTSSTDNKQI